MGIAIENTLFACPESQKIQRQLAITPFLFSSFRLRVQRIAASLDCQQ
jgi:hypothetical protein